MLLLASTYHRRIHLDDAWLGEQAYFLSSQGVVKSDLFAGVLNYKNEVLVYHKFFIILGAAVVSVFGFGIAQLKSISLFFIIAFCFVFWRSSEKLWTFHRSQKIIFLSLLLSFHLIFEQSYMFRPEVMLLLLGYVIFYQLGEFLKTNALKHLVIANLLTGLAIFTHLNGIMYLFATFVLLWFEGKRKAAFMSPLIAAPIGSLYVYNFNVFTELQAYKNELLMDPGLFVYKSHSPSWWSLPLRLIDEQKRFLSHPYNTLLTALTLFSIWRLRVQKDFNHTDRRALLFFLACTFCIALISPSKTNKYLILTAFIPIYFCTRWLSVAFLQKSQNIRYLTAALVAGYVGTNTYKNIQILKSQSLFPYTTEALLSEAQVESDAVIFAPVSAIFNSLPEHHFLSETGQIIITEFYNNKKSPEDLVQQIQSQDVDYVLIGEKISDPKIINIFPQLKKEWSMALIKELNGVQLYKVTK
ncbi:MAG: glycosyltransferase family 39 protein [Bdellovibrionaceae bacterium]|nr:glycosyltransferase family 39 protein [Pseudobdellovibrionaceae bacterium]